MEKGYKIGLGVAVVAALTSLFFFKKPKTGGGTTGGGTATGEDAEFEKYMPYIFDFEGGYTPADGVDRGGETNWGITKKNYPNLDIKNLTKSAAKEIYYRDYWKKGRCTVIPKSIRFLYFDTFINGGGVAVLQRAANVKIDGVLGPLTIVAAAIVTPTTYTTARKKRYEIIIQNDPTQIKFKQGWINRANKAFNAQIKINSIA